jgi:hypothetical protein
MTDYNYDQKRVREAVQFLVDSPYFSQHVRKLRSQVKRPRALPFKDAAEPLNELLVLGRQSFKAMENLIAIAEFKRTDRNDYQREFMAAKRARQRKVIKLEEVLTGRTLTVDQRARVLLRQSAIWEKEKDQYLERRAEGMAQAPSWTERNNFIRDFWKLKETEIDSLLEEAHRVHDRTVKRKRVVEVEKPEKPTAMGEAMKKYLAGRG